MRLAAKIVPCRIVMPFSLRWALTVSSTKSSAQQVDLLTQSVLLPQVAKGEDRGLIGGPVADQLDCLAPVSGARREPQSGPPPSPDRSVNTTAAKGFCAATASQKPASTWPEGTEAGRLSCLPWGNGARSDRSVPAMAPLPPSQRETSRAWSASRGCGQLVVRETELLAAYQSSPGL